MSQMQGAWIRRGYRISKMTHSVHRIHCHFEGEHPAYYDKNDDEQKKKSKIAAATLCFLQCMKVMSARPELRDLTFEQLCNRMRYDEKKKMFVEYKRPSYAEKNLYYLPPAIYTIFPGNLEKYGLYVLVRERAGYTSFEELRTDPSGVVQTSFMEAARAMGLIDDDREWDVTLKIGTSVYTGYMSRVLFGTILANCDPPNPRELWEKYKDKIIDRDANATVEELYNRALIHIKMMLKQRNKKYKSFGLPKVVPDALGDRIKKDLSRRAAERKADEMRRQLNAEQKELADDMIVSIRDKKNSRRLFMVTGSGGCGKTFLYTYVYNWCLANNFTRCWRSLPLASHRLCCQTASPLTRHSRFHSTRRSTELRTLTPQKEDSKFCPKLTSLSGTRFR